MSRAACVFFGCALLLLPGCGGTNGITITPNPAIMATSDSGPQPVQFQATLRAMDGTLQDVTATAVWTVSDSNMIAITNSGIAVPRQGVTIPCGFSTNVTATQGVASGSAVLKLGC